MVNFLGLIHSVASTPSQCFVLFSFGSSTYNKGCAVAPVSAQLPVEHVKNYLQDIKTEGMTHNVFHLPERVGADVGAKVE